MAGNYEGIKAVCYMLRNKGIITNEEYMKCIKELDNSWDKEINSTIDEMLEKVIKKDSE